MSPRITIVSATENEIAPTWDFFKQHADQHSFQSFHYRGLHVDFLISGIGIMQTTYSLMEYISHRHPDVWIQAGVGGAFDEALALTAVYQLQREMLSGFGAEDADGQILDQFTLGWSDPDAFPYTAGWLECPYTFIPSLPAVSGMTTQYAHGYEPHISRLHQAPHGQLENMEGVPFFYISLIRRIPFISIRAISNRVEKRDKDKWKMHEAIVNLNQTLLRALDTAGYHPQKLIRDLRL